MRDRLSGRSALACVTLCTDSSAALTQTHSEAVTISSAIGLGVTL
jgi:hypothetical protein